MMQHHLPAPFKLERYFARHEFSARYLLSCSDCEPLGMAELVAMADETTGRLWRELKLGYTESPGHPLLRNAIADLYSGITPEDILVSAPEEGIFLFMQSLLTSGDHVICMFPAYQSLYELARFLGCEISFWKPEEGREWHFDVARLADLFQPRTRLVVVNFPHNPTGYLPSEDQFAAILKLAGEHGAIVFCDEMYRQLEHPPARTLPSACEADEKAVVLAGLSKAYGLPGLRIGWVVCRDAKIRSRMAELKDYTTICSSAPSEILALMALQNRERIVGRQKVRLECNLKLLEAFFARHVEAFSPRPPSGGSVCFPKMTIARNTLDFCEKLVAEAGIMLVPSHMFGFGNRHVRMGFGRDDFAVVLDRFSDYLHHLGE